jgi:DNA polymerase-3 subunit delta'
MARFVLTHPHASATEVQSATSLGIAQDHPVVRRIAARAHSDLLALERTAGPTGALRTVITVDEVRRTGAFFGSTAGEGGWRVCIIDTADELQLPQAVNALLKVLEEPPPRALFLLVSNAPGRLLPTIRSRCRQLALRPLPASEVAKAAAFTLRRDPEDPELRQSVAAAHGSIGRAAMLIGGPALAVREQVLELVGLLPEIDTRALHALADTLGRADQTVFEMFVDTVRDWLTDQLSLRLADTARLAPIAEVWEKLDRAAREVELYNLDRKPLVFAVFGLLAETARR